MKTAKKYIIIRQQPQLLHYHQSESTSFTLTGGAHSYYNDEIPTVRLVLAKSVLYLEGP